MLNKMYLKKCVLDAGQLKSVCNRLFVWYFISITKQAMGRLYISVFIIKAHMAGETLIVIFKYSKICLSFLNLENLEQKLLKLAKHSFLQMERIKKIDKLLTKRDKKLFSQKIYFPQHENTKVTSTFERCAALSGLPKKQKESKKSKLTEVQHINMSVAVPEQEHGLFNSDISSPGDLASCRNIARSVLLGDKLFKENTEQIEETLTSVYATNSDQMCATEWKQVTYNPSTTEHELLNSEITSPKKSHGFDADDLASCQNFPGLILLGDKFKEITEHNEDTLVSINATSCDQMCAMERKQVTNNPSTTVRRALFREDKYRPTAPKQTDACHMTPVNTNMIQWLETQLKMYQNELHVAKMNGSKSTMKRKARRILQYKRLIKQVNMGQILDLSNLLHQINSPDKVRKVIGNISLSSGHSVRSNKGKSLCDDTSIAKHAEDSNLKKAGIKRLSRKENYCIECKKKVKEFCKHYENVHRDTLEGQKLLELNKLKDIGLRKQLKTKLTDSLRKKGNAEFSQANAMDSFFKGGDATVIPVKRSLKESANQNNTVQCAHCEGYYRRRKFSQHLKHCQEFLLATQPKLQGNVDAIKGNSLPVLINVEGASTELIKEVLQIMKPRKTKDVALRDPLIMRYASEFHKTRRAVFQRVYVSRVITDLSRILMRIREIEGDNIHCLEDVFNPAYFSVLVNCILEEGGYELESGAVEKCGLANRLRSHIKGAAETAKKDALAEQYRQPSANNASKTKQIKHFLKIMDEKWANEVGRIFDMAVKKSRSENEPKMAAEEDIIKVCQYVCSQYRIVMKKLEEAQPGSTDKQKFYNSLMDLLITHIMCLIRRRPVDFKRGLNLHYEKLDSQEDLVSEVQNSKYMEMSDKDLELCNKFKIFYVPGKGWKELVPIALTGIMKETMDALQRNKKHVGITSDKLFVRARDMQINPRECLRKIIKNLVLKKPLDISGNGLRHHAATFSKLHSSHPQYQDYLASALGHTLHIHKLHYEMPSNILQKLIVCPVLHSMTLPVNEREEISTLQDGITSPSTQIEKIRDPEATIFDTTETDSISIDRDNLSSSSEEQSTILKKKHNISRQRWTEEEKIIIYNTFGRNIIEHKQTPRSEVVKFFNRNLDVFKTRTADSLVAFLHNQTMRKQKNVTPEIKRLANMHRRKTNELTLSTL